ncbi:hypothetical protein FKP32DRAFT_175137 [Trametes sanguinea]|nr:hypothetical protein FKP32DRAFT_175137 [Trametes sanguinea]
MSLLLRHVSRSSRDGTRLTTHGNADDPIHTADAPSRPAGGHYYSREALSVAAEFSPLPLCAASGGTPQPHLRRRQPLNLRLPILPYARRPSSANPRSPSCCPGICACCGVGRALLGRTSWDRLVCSPFTTSLLCSLSSSC